MIRPYVDYREFRFSKLSTPEFSHVWLLLFWPAFGLLFSYVERFYPVTHYIEMHCALDDLIPFNEWFLIPYLFWFVYLIGAVAYTFFFDVPGFRRMMNYECILYGIKGLIFGLPVSLVLSFLMYKSMVDGIDVSFMFPWQGMLISAFSVFAIVFITMLYAMRKVGKENTIEALRNENL